MWAGRTFSKMLFRVLPLLLPQVDFSMTGKNRELRSDTRVFIFFPEEKQRELDNDKGEKVSKEKSKYSMRCNNRNFRGYHPPLFLWRQQSEKKKCLSSLLFSISHAKGTQKERVKKHKKTHTFWRHSHFPLLLLRFPPTIHFANYVEIGAFSLICHQADAF